ncbi:hypothetical protein BGZ76_000300 [Entomortierella beljakovae]|nr:hypothetical protein BGZ76_000300 [Entomortierella beljakovae]
MTPIAPLWWFKEVPVQLEAFVDTLNGVKHIVPFPRQLQSNQTFDKNTQALENQGGVFAFPNQNAKSVVWRTTENATVLELTSISGKENNSTRPISFQFHAPILPGIHFASLAPHGGITIALLTVDSILYKLHISALSHFLTKDLPQGYSSAAQIKWPTSNAAPSLFKYLGDRLAAVSTFDGSLFLVKTALLAEDTNRHGHAEVKVFDLHDDSHHISRTPDTSKIQKFRSIFHNGAEHTNGFLEHKTRLDILAMESYTTHDDTLLFTLHQDRVIRVWSTGRRQCLQAMRSPLNPNDAGYVQETIGLSSRAHLGIMFNPLMPWVLRLLVYIPGETDAQLVIYSSRIDTMEDVGFVQGSISTIRPDSATGPGSNPANLIKIQIILNESQTGYAIWGLWEGNMKISLKYILIDDPVAEREDFRQFVKRDLLDGRWWPVAMQTPLSGFVKSMSAVDDSVEDISKYYAEFIFTSGRFSDRTIMRALDTLFGDQAFQLKPDLQDQVIQAMSVQSLNSISDSENKRHQEIMNWTRFISYCAKLDYVASAPLGLSIALNTGYMIVVKQDALSFITACDDSEILYHTFHDKQFEVAQFIATPQSQLRSIYPKLQDPAVRNDVSKIFKAIGFLTHHLTVESSKNLESVIAQLSKVNGPRNFVDILMQDHLIRIIPKTDMNRARNLVTSCKAPTDIFQFINSQLLYSADSGPARATSERCILPYEALVASSIQQLSGSRYSLSQNLLILLCVCYSAPASSRTWIQDETECISDVLRITQVLLVLKWISNRTISSTPSLPSELERKLSQMQVRDSTAANAKNSFRQSLTGFLLKTMSSKTNKYGTAEFPIFFAVPRAVSTFLHVLGIMNQGQDEISKYHVGLAQRLSSRGEMTLLSQFLDIVPTNSALPYYRGKVLLSQQKPEKALEQLLAVTASFGNDIGYVEQELDIMQQDYTTGAIAGHAKLEDYYNNVIALFVECDAHEQVIVVSKLALTSIARNPKLPGAETQVRTLLEGIIHAALAIGSYERAFNAMMLIQNENLKKQVLRKFVSKISENGDGAKLSLFAFGGLQDDVERILKLNAEKSPVLLKPDNYQILYAYYIYKGEYKKGATIMYQYAKRLCDGKNKSEPIWRLLSEAGSSLLAAINALYLAGPSNAWISVPTYDSDQRFDEPSKRRKLSNAVAGESFTLSTNDARENTLHRVDVIHLSDIRQEFALISAKLRLVTNVPSQLIPGVLTMTPRETQLLLVHCGFHEEATSLALKFNLDLSVILSALVERYLMALSIEQEEFLKLGGLRSPNNTRISNSKSSTSLQVLQSYLERHDNSSSNYKYRLVAIESILTINPNFDLQPWLTQHYLKHNPEDLIRLYMKFGVLEKAAKFASAVISSAIKKDELISRHSNARWLPYSLLDEIFVELNEQIKQTQDQLPKIPTPDSRQPKLEQQLQGLKKLKLQLDEDVQLYLENVERESIF